MIRTSSAPLLIALCSGAIWLGAASAQAQSSAEEDDAPTSRRVSTTAVLIREDDAELGDATRIEIGLRRGIREIDGLKFVHPADVLSVEEVPADVADAIAGLDRIAEKIRSGEAQSALEDAEAVIETLEEHLVVVRRADLTDAYLLKATAQCELGHERECTDGFEVVLTFRETAEYDPVRYPPAHLTRFEEVRANLLNDGRRGSLQITTEPAGAEVFVDGRSYGPSPAIAEGLLIGAHYVTVKVIGYEKVIRRATVSPTEEQTLDVNLERSSRARLLEDFLPSIRSEVGRRRAGSALAGIRGYLYVNQVIVGVIRPLEDDQLEVHAYLYDLRTRFLLGEERIELPAGPAAEEKAKELALALYEDADLTGAVSAPQASNEERTEEVRSPFWQRWWFWTAVGAVVVSGVVALTVIDTDSNVPEGWTRIDGQL